MSKVNVVCAGILGNSHLDEEAKLRDYDPRWPSLYQAEKEVIKDAILKYLPCFRDVEQSDLFQIHHIGSTSVPGMRALAVIDIEIGLSLLYGMDVNSEGQVVSPNGYDRLEKLCFQLLVTRGYQLVSINAKRAFFWKPFSSDTVLRSPCFFSGLVLICFLNRLAQQAHVSFKI